MAQFREQFPVPGDPHAEVLLVPSRPLAASHWMAVWAQRHACCRIIELGLWDEPHRNTWVNRLNLAVRRVDRPVIVVTDDIAALALAWWVDYEGEGLRDAVLGAFIVNPPDLDRPGRDPRLARFGAVPRTEMPFRTFLVSHVLGDNCYQRATMRLARDWGARPVCDAPMGEWARGWAMLQAVLHVRLSDRETVRPLPLPAPHSATDKPRQRVGDGPRHGSRGPVPAQGPTAQGLSSIVWC